MSKYQEVMNHIKVDDEMKKRILQNVEKKLEEAPQVETPKGKVIPFRRYAAIAATFTVLLLGSYAVMQVTGGITNTSSSTSTSVYEPVMEEAASMSEAPAYEAAAEAPDMEAAAEAPAYEAAAEPADEATEPAPGFVAETPSHDDIKNGDNVKVEVGGNGQMATGKVEAEHIIAESSEVESRNRKPIVPIVLSVTVAALVIAAIIMFVIKKKR